MNLPDILLETQSHINFTILLSVITVSIATMGTIVKIYSKKRELNDIPGMSSECTQHAKNVKRNENTTIENSRRLDIIKDSITSLEKEVAILEIKFSTTEKSMDEVKGGSKEIAKRLDNLLKQLLDMDKLI